MTDQVRVRPAGAGATGNFLGAIAMMAWAAGFPAADVLLRDWDPLVAVAGRVLFATVPLLPLWFILDPGGWRRPGLWRGIVIGGIGFGGGAITIILAQWHTDAVTVAIIAAASPLTAAVVEWLDDRVPLTRPFLAGLALTLLGGIVATGGGVPGNLGFGAALALASCFLFSWASHRTNRDLPNHSLIGRTTITTAGAMLFLWIMLGVALAAGWSVLPATPITNEQIGLLIIYGTGAMAVSQLAFIAAVQRLGISVASFHINIAPFYVMVLMLALGGGWNWAQAIGAAIVASGVVIAQRPTPARPVSRSAGRPPVAPPPSAR